MSTVQRRERAVRRRGLHPLRVLSTLSPLAVSLVRAAIHATGGATPDWSVGAVGSVSVEPLLLLNQPPRRIRIIESTYALGPIRCEGGLR
jgi:hypothetical protein